MKQTIHYLCFYVIGSLCILTSSFIFFTELKDQVQFEGVGLFTFSGCFPISYRLTYRGYQETPFYMMIQFVEIFLIGMVIFAIQDIFRNVVTLQAIVYAIMLCFFLTILLYLNAKMEDEFTKMFSTWPKLPTSGGRTFNRRNRKVFKLIRMQ